MTRCSSLQARPSTKSPFYARIGQALLAAKEDGADPFAALNARFRSELDAERCGTVRRTGTGMTQGIRSSRSVICRGTSRENETASSRISTQLAWPQPKPGREEKLRQRKQTRYCCLNRVRSKDETLATKVTSISRRSRVVASAALLNYTRWSSFLKRRSGETKRLHR